MRKRTRIWLATGITAVAMMLVPGGAALANPNVSGNSDHFNPNSNPCGGGSDQPNCPGPH